MLRILKARPEGLFEQTGPSAIFFEGYDDNGTYGYTAIEFIIDNASMHLEVVRWSHGILKKMIEDWKTIKMLCEFHNCKRILASQPDTTDTRWPKLIKHFGFPQPKAVLVSRQEV